MNITGICATCGARWSIQTTAAYARPVCTNCYVKEGRYEDMKIVKTVKTGTCEAMRCEAPAQRLVAYVPEMGHERTSGLVSLCEKHAAQAFIDHGVRVEGGVDIAPRGASPFGQARTPDEVASDYARTPALNASHEPPLAVIPTTSVEAEIAANTAYANDITETIGALAITTKEELDLFSEALADVKGRLKAVVARKEEITKPMNAALTSARALFRPAENALSHAEDVIKGAIAAFARREEENKRAALEAAAEAHKAGNTAAVGEALARAVTVKNTEGIQVRHVWKFEVTDADAVPRELCSPDVNKIRDLMKVVEDPASLGIPGVRFYQDAVVASRSS